MKRYQQQSGGSSDYNEPTVREIEFHTISSEESKEVQLLDMLMDTGFDWEEAIQLINLREHLYENMEMRQRVADDSRMHFARWLYENGELGEHEK